MNGFNPFFLSNLLIVVSFLPVSIFLILRGKSKASKLVALWLSTVTMWGLGAMLVDFTDNPATALILWKPTYCAVLFIPVFYSHCVLEITNKKNPFIICLLYFQALIFSFLTFAGKLFYDVRWIFDTIYWTNGSLYHFISFVIWLIIISFSSYLLLLHYKKSQVEQRTTITLLTTALVGFSGGVMNFFPTYGLNIFPVGNFLIPISSIAITYSILKHQLFDIRIAIKRSIVYYLLFLIISLLYLIIIVLSEKTLHELVKYQSTSISVITAFIIGALFFPLRNKIQKVVDKSFFIKSSEEIERENILLKSHAAQTEKMKSIALLASGMAHEIKNPLTPIKTFLEYLPQKTNDKEFIRKFGDLARASVDRIDELINELLKFAKPSPLQLTNSDINKLIDNTLDLLSSEFLKHHIQVSKQLTEPILLHVDQNQIRQALLNILLNAIDAMPNGGTLTVQTERISKGKKQLYRVSIQDTGRGIAKDDIPHIFDPFFTKKDKGTGLGLSITSGIIAEHDGTIKAVSAPGQGATFIIELPIKDDSS